MEKEEDEVVNESVKCLPDGSKLLVEGKAEVIYNSDEVFYNPIQEFNRDLSIVNIKLLIETLQKEESEGKSHSCKKRTEPGITILEGLSATGLRSIRYWKEIEGIHSIVVNDLEPAAVETIRKNIEHNNIDTTKCIPNEGDCSMVMYTYSRNKQKLFDVVDIDPYGTASPFLDAAVQAVDNGGLLCVTCTDLAVLCGSHPETCYSKYQAIPLKGEHCHETALRIVINNIQSHAIRYKRYIEPMISIYVDFYVRIFVRVYDSAHYTKEAFSHSGMLYQCGGCKTFTTEKFGSVENEPSGKKYKMKIGPAVSSKCQFCGSAVKMGGPLWLDSIHNYDWVKRAIDHLSTPESKTLYKTHKRLLGLLSMCHEELPNSPLFYVHSALCLTTKLETPSLVSFRSAVLSTGYKVSGSHCIPNAIKTDAPNEVIWDILRCWHKQRPAALSKMSDQSPGYKILQKEPTIQADFTKRKDAITAASKLPRFFHTPGGGPKSKAKGKRKAPKPSGEKSPQKRKISPENEKEASDPDEKEEET